MKRIINWCSGGVGNRLRPLAACHSFAKQTGRTLAACWQPTTRCMTYFHDLYENEIELLEFKDIANLESVSIYSEKEYIVHDAKLNGNQTLFNLMTKYGHKSLANTGQINHDTADNIIVYDNNFFAGADAQLAHSFIKQLIPLVEIQHKIGNFLKETALDKSWIGVHARGTDFESRGISAETYVKKMNSYPQKKFFVCSDSLEYEQYVTSKIPNSIFNKKQAYVGKSHAGEWDNNVMTPKESVQDSLVDMYLLAKTDFLIYREDSTYAEIIKILSS